MPEPKIAFFLSVFFALAQIKGNFFRKYKVRKWAGKMPD